MQTSFLTASSYTFLWLAFISIRRKFVWIIELVWIIWNKSILRICYTLTMFHLLRYCLLNTKPNVCFIIFPNILFLNFLRFIKIMIYDLLYCTLPFPKIKFKISSMIMTLRKTCSAFVQNYFNNFLNFSL